MHVFFIILCIFQQSFTRTFSEIFIGTWVPLPESLNYLVWMLGFWKLILRNFLEWELLTSRSGHNVQTLLVLSCRISSNK